MKNGFILCVSALLLQLSACRSNPSVPEKQISAQPQIGPVVASGGASPAQSPKIEKATARSMPTRIENRGNQAKQLDLGSEGGTRDGSYAMWIHVTAGNNPVGRVAVIAYDSGGKKVASALTNADGDARLLVQLADYRIKAKGRGGHAELAVSYHPGDQFDLQLEP